MRHALRRGSIILTTGALAAALLSLLPVRAWPLEFLASFRVQIITVCFVSAGIAFLARLRLWGALGIVFALVLAGFSLPPFVTAGHYGSRAEGEPLRILTLNLEWSNRDLDGVLGLIRRTNPDIVALQEVDWWWRRKLEVLAAEYPARIFDESSPKPGVAVLAKGDPERVEWYSVCGRAFASVLLRDGDRRLRLVNVHAYPPKTPYLYDLRNRQLDAVAGRVPHDAVPTILAGDLNTTPWSTVLRDFERTTGLRSTRAGRGTIPTWPSWNMLFGVPIDHVYCSDRFVVDDVVRVAIPGSDHCGLMATLRLGGARG
ncbi:MAG: endonuclease/exonuclease/phosphatase family protein [Candidatus Eisenbacteria bacterium]